MIGHRHQNVRGTLALILGLALTMLATGQTIELREEVYVKGPKVRLGDVARISGEGAEALASVELAPAAIPGGVRYFNATLVMSRIRNAGFDTDDFDFKGSRRVTARTLHLDITGDMLTEDLRAFIARDMPWSEEDAYIQVSSPGKSYIVPDGEVEFRWYRDPRYAYLGRGSFRGEVLVDGRIEKTLYLKSDIRAYGDVLTARADLRRGDVLSPLSVQLERRELSSLERGAFRSMLDVNGLVVKGSIPRGAVITERKVTPPTLVKRNQMVPIETRVGGIVVRGTAKAMQDGVVGSTVRCLNVESKQAFTGYVREDGTVVVR